MHIDIDHWFHCGDRLRPWATLVVAPVGRRPILFQGFLMAAFILKDDEKVTVSITAVDDQGNPVPAPTFDAPPAWTTSDATTLTVTPSTDGLTCELATTGKLGGTVSVTVTVKVGGKTEIGSQDFTIMPSAAIGIGIAPGTPVKR